MSGTIRNAPAGAPTFRFAPSPNGELHLGHACSALLNAQMSGQVGGRLLLRIEDIDVERCTPAFEAAIMRDLKWLGLTWEQPVRRQSEHFSDYAEIMARLIGEGLAYPAFMSRTEVRSYVEEAEANGRQWPRDPDGVPHYPGLDRSRSQRERDSRIAEGAALSWRLDSAAALSRSGPLSWMEFTDAEMTAVTRVPAEPEHWGDVVLARRDIPTSYHLSVVLDDALQGVTHVVRGMDLRPATAIHRLLQSLLSLPEPTYFHHRLIVGPDGRKLSKSQGDTGLHALRLAGRSPADIKRLIEF